MGGAPGVPADTRDERDAEHDRNEYRRDLVGELLDGRFAGLGVIDELDDLRQGRLPAGLGDADGEPAVVVDRAADDGVAHRPRDRARLAGNHRFIDGGPTLGHHAVDGDAVAGADQHLVVHLKVTDGNFFVLARRTEPLRHRRREIQQLSDGRAGRLAGAGLEPVAQADQREQAGRFHEV